MSCAYAHLISINNERKNVMDSLFSYFAKPPQTPLLIQPASPSSPVETSKVKPLGDIAIIKNTFLCISRIGVVGMDILVHDLQIRKANNMPITNQSLCVDDDMDIRWLINLDDDGIEKVRELVSSLRDNLVKGLDYFKFQTDLDEALNTELRETNAQEGSTQYKRIEDFYLDQFSILGKMEVALVDPSWFKGVGKCRISSDCLFARSGDIYLRIPNEHINVIEEVRLMSTRTLLENCKDSLGNLPLCNVDLNSAKLAGAYLDGADLRDTDLRSADLQGASLRQVSFFRACFGNEANLQGASITFKLPEWNRDTLDQWLNHLANSSSLLRTIDSINDQHTNKEGKVIKIDLMHQIIDSFQEIDTSSVHAALMDIWMKNPIYTNDEKICSFIQAKIVPKKIVAANTSMLITTGEPELQQLLNNVKNKVGNERTTFMLKNNGFFVQLMMLCTENAIHADIKDQSVKLYEEYLNLPELADGKRHMELNDGDISDTQDQGLAFVFYKKVGNINHHLLLDKNQMQAMLKSAPAVDWACVYFVENGETLSNQNLEKIFDLFSLFSPAYSFHLHRNRLPGLLKTINLDHRNESNNPVLLNKNYLPLIEDALNVHSLYKNNAKEDKYNLTRKPDQETLKQLFGPLLADNVYLPVNDQVDMEARSISSAHFQALISALNLSSSPTSEKARTLFCISAIFVRLSSSYFFGAENDSPEALRVYGAALMIKAYELDPSVFGIDSETQKATFTGWMKRLLGGKDENGNSSFTCTAVLSDIMFSHANKDPAIKKAMETGIKPRCWV